MRRWLAHLIVPVLLAGCAAETAPVGESSPETREDGAAGVGPEGDAVAIAFEGTPIDAEAQFTGTLAGAPGCGPGCDGRARHEVTEFISRTYYVQLTLELTWTMGTGATGSPPSIAIESGNSHVLRSNSSTDFNARRVEQNFMLKAGDGPVTAIVSRSDGGYGDQSIQYTLHVRATGDPSEFPPGMRIHIPLRANVPLWMAPAAATRPVDAVLYTADGTMKATLSVAANTSIELDETASSHILVLKATSGPAKLWVPASERFAPQLVSVELTWGPPRQFVGGSPVEWTFEITDKVPVQAGIYFSIATPLHVEPIGIKLRLESPAGLVMDQSFTCPPPCFIGGPGRGAQLSVIGEPNLVLGTYTARVESQNPRVSEVGEVLSHFKLP